jgi:hypothetical protein
VAIDLFSLRMNLETAGVAGAMGHLRGLDAQGKATAAGLGGVAGGMQRVSMEARASEAATGAVAARFGMLGGAVTALGPLAIGAGAGFLVLNRLMSATTPEADALRLSMLRLDGASRITGISLDFLQRISRQTQEGFRLSAVQANDLTASAAKVAGKTGELNQAGPFLAAWLNVAAAQGMGASQALDALNITLRGQDEGLDKLFQKNPSVIWKEYAVSIGTTVGKLTEAQKWQAIVNATMEASVKVGDAYNRFLDTAAGKATILANANERFQASLGRVFEPLRGWLSGVGADFLNWLADLGERISRVSIGGGGLSGLAMRLGVALVGGGERVNNWDDLDMGMAGVTGGSSNSTTPVTPTPRTPLTEAQQAAIRKAYVDRLLGTLDASPADRLTPIAQSPIGVRGGDVGPITAGTGGGFNAGARGDAVEQWAQRMRQSAAAVRREFSQLGQNLGMTLADGFAAAMAAGVQGKNPFVAFGKAVLSGLGSIFTQMGAELIAYGVIMLNLLPFLSNPFTSGPAAIAAGAALVAVGTVLGGLATGSGAGNGGGASSASRDRTTQITLTADGAGGLTAPKGKGALDGVALLTVDSPQGQRVLSTTMAHAKRRNL